MNLNKILNDKSNKKKIIQKLSQKIKWTPKDNEDRPFVIQKMPKDFVKKEIKYWNYYKEVQDKDLQSKYLSQKPGHNLEGNIYCNY